MSDYDETYARFWAPILDAPGVDREDRLRRELHDYHFLMGQVSIVYDNVSGGRISKPNTMAFEVVGQHDETFAGRRDVADDLRRLAGDGVLDETALREAIVDYARDLDPNGGAS